MDTVSLDSLQAISTFAPNDVYDGLRPTPIISTTRTKMDKDFEHAMQGMSKEIKEPSSSMSSSRLSSSVLETNKSSVANDAIWGQRYQYTASASKSPPPPSFSFSKRKLLHQSKSNKGATRTNLSKFGQCSTNSKFRTADTSTRKSPEELNLYRLQLMPALRQLKRGNSAKGGLSFIFGQEKSTVEKHDRKNIPSEKPKPVIGLHTNRGDSDNDSVTDSVATSSTEESSQYEEELITVLCRIELASSQPSASFQFGSDLTELDPVDIRSKTIPTPEKSTKLFVQHPHATHLLTVQEESLREATERQREKAFFW